MSEVHVLENVMRPFPAFRDRRDAGCRLVEFMGIAGRENAVVVALPRGGAPVSEPFCRVLRAPLELAITRKLPVPGRPEAGFGAVAVDGTRVLNRYVVDHFSLSDAVIDSVTEKVKSELNRRAREYLNQGASPHVQGKSVFLVDDGLATGYTALAAAKMIRRLDPASITLCVPVSPWDSIMTVEDYVDRLFILYLQEFPPFAVATFYENFTDISDEEVLDILRQTRLVSDREELTAR